MFVSELWIPQSYIFFALDDSLTISAMLSSNSHTYPLACWEAGITSTHHTAMLKYVH